MYRVGTDIVEVERIRSLIDKFGDKFLNKVFSSEEIRYCQLHKYPSVHFAGRFSVKESIRKAVSALDDITSFRFNQISIINDNKGRPYLDKNSFPLVNIDISISHTQTHAISIAILDNA